MATLCKTCKKPIRFLKTSTGKLIPVDDEFVKLRARAEAAERKLDAVRHTFIVEKDGSITEYHGELLLKEK